MSSALLWLKYLFLLKVTCFDLCSSQAIQISQQSPPTFKQINSSPYHYCLWAYWGCTYSPHPYHWEKCLNWSQHWVLVKPVAANWIELHLSCLFELDHSASSSSSKLYICTSVQAMSSQFPRRKLWEAVFFFILLLFICCLSRIHQNRVPGPH